MDVINKFLKTNFDRQQRKIVWRQIVIFGSVLMMTFAFAPPIGFIDTLIRIIIMAALAIGSIIRWFGVLEMERKEKGKKNARKKS